MKKLVLAAALTMVATTATASKVEWSFGFGDSAIPVDEMLFGYNSQSIVTDVDGDGVISDGDTIQSYGGYGTSGFDSLPPLVGADTFTLSGNGFDSISNNKIGDFDPGTPNFPAGYGNDYTFSFFFNDLMGKWVGDAAGGFVYSSGTLQVGYIDYTGTNTFENLFKINIASGGNTPFGGQAQQVFNGEVDETSLENGAGTAFTLTEGGTTQSLSDWLAGNKRVLFASSQTVNGDINNAPQFAQQIDFGSDDKGLLAAEHRGGFELNVPEPSTLAVLGLSLIGFGAAARKRKA